MNDGTRGRSGRDDPGRPFELLSERLGALPVVDEFLARMGVAGLLDRHLPDGDARVSLPAATVIGVLVRNLCLEREFLRETLDS